MGKGIQSVVIGFRLLKAIVDEDEPVSLKSLAAMAGLVSQQGARLSYQSHRDGADCATFSVRLLHARAVCPAPCKSSHKAGRPYHCSIRSWTINPGCHRCTYIDKWLEFSRHHASCRALKVQALCHFTSALVALRRLSAAPLGMLCWHMGKRSETKPCLDAEWKAMALTQGEKKKAQTKLDAHVQKAKREGIAYVPQVTLVTGVALSGFAAVAAPIFGEAHQLRLIITALFQSQSGGLDKTSMVEIVRGACTRASTMAGGSIT